MTGTAIQVDVDTRQVEAMLKAMKRRFGHMRPAMKIIGQTIRTSVVENFQQGGRPDAWEPLSDATLLTKKGDKILVEQGFAGGLEGSIHPEHGDNWAMVGTDKAYGAIHQFGGPTGRGHKTMIPARPFLEIQDEDWQAIIEQLNDYLMG
jgi:phage virion morphogenesis protein